MDNSSQEKEKDIKRFALNEDTWTDSIKNKENVYWSHSCVMRDNTFQTRTNAKGFLNIDEHRKRLRERCPWEEIMDQWSNECISVASEVSLTLIQFATMKKSIRMCAAFVLKKTADDWDTTKIISNELSVTFQDINYDTTVAWRTHSVGENDDIQTFQDCLSRQEGMNLNIEFFRVNIHCRIETTRNDTT